MPVFAAPSYACKEASRKPNCNYVSDRGKEKKETCRRKQPDSLHNLSTCAYSPTVTAASAPYLENSGTSGTQLKGEILSLSRSFPPLQICRRHSRQSFPISDRQSCLSSAASSGTWPGWLSTNLATRWMEVRVRE